MRSVSLRLLVLIIQSLVIAPMALAVDESVPAVNVIQEGRTYLALSSDERGYALAFESPEYREFLNGLRSQRALALCQEAGLHEVAGEPKTELVKTPEPLEAWSVEEGVLTMKSYETGSPWVFTNNGCKRLKLWALSVPTVVGLTVGAGVNIACAVIAPPFALPFGLAAVGFGSAVVEIIRLNRMNAQAPAVLPIRAKKALERREGGKVARQFALPLMKNKKIPHEIFTEVLCK